MIYEKAPAANVPFLQKSRGEKQTPANQAASSLASPLTKACNYVGNFLTQDLTAIKTLETFRKLDFLALNGFRLCDLTKKLVLSLSQKQK